jgi:anthranilate synthase
LNGDINTGILIRTIHVHSGRVEYPVGATLLYDSVPEMEERETRLKATGFFRALRAPVPAKAAEPPEPAGPSPGPKLLLVDNADCFIHTLSNYARQTGAEVVTYRAGFPLELIDQIQPDLILISPGPGRPEDFGVPDLVRYAAKREIPLFGVCLGLQGIVEAFGGELGVLEYPMHGKPSQIKSYGMGVFEGLPEQFQVGRYHSLYAIREKFPECLEITAETEDGVIMGVRHRTLPIEAVQFHPESLLSLDNECGLRLMRNVIALYGRARAYAQR